MVKISIIILNYKDNQGTFECIKSLENQIFKNFEVIVIDNSENNEIFLELKNLLNQFNEILEIKLIQSKYNLFFASGVNLGIIHSQGDYICLLNNDTIVDSDFLDKSIKFMESNSKIGFMCPKINLYKNPNKNWFSGYKIKPFSRNFLYFLKNKNLKKVQETDYAPGAALFVKREIINLIGTLDEIFFMYWEDVDWCYRAKRYGFKNYYFPNTIVYHKIEKIDPKKEKTYKFYLKLRNFQIMVWKNFNPIEILSFYITNFSFLTLKTLLFSIFKRKFKNVLVVFRAIFMGFFIGLRRRTKKSCKKLFKIEFFFVRSLIKAYFS